MNSAYRKNLIISALCASINLPVQAATEGTVTPPTNTTNVAPVTTAPAPAKPVTNTSSPSDQNKTTTPDTNNVKTTPVTPPEPAIVRPITEIANLIASKQHSYLTQMDFTNRIADLDTLYQASGYQPIWLTNDVKATERVAEIIKLLNEASSHGLNSADYDTQTLEQKLSAIKPPLDLKSKELALYDTAISLSLLRFTYDLHYGRINPRKLHPNIQLRTEKKLDLVELIKANQNNIVKLPDLVEPQLPQYKKLKEALVNYQGTKQIQPLNLNSNTNIRPGNPLEQSIELQEFLVSSGDLATDKVDKSVTTYTDTLVEAVKKYQQRRGLKANGIINKATKTAFSKPISSAQKATQISLAMERLRWLPDITEGRAVIVNIPAFQLFAYDDIQQDSPTKTMRVVVGKSAKHKTPILTAEMKFVDFQPFWHVPFKIARDEILPHLLNNPDYLAGHNMEVVSRSGKRLGSDGGSFAAQIRQGSIGIRQLPGRGNALGKVKFIFPNKSDVYLHDTPSVGLFSRARRDLSHGCVRVAQPQQLAEFVLQPESESDWTTDSIKRAMNGRNRRVTLKETIPVLFLYNTAFFNENNQLTFYADIYQHDNDLLEALKKQRKDLADADLFAPKEVVPVEENQDDKTIEVQHNDGKTSAKAKAELPQANNKPLNATTTTVESVAVANVKQIAQSNNTTSKETKETTISQ